MAGPIRPFTSSRWSRYTQPDQSEEASQSSSSESARPVFKHRTSRNLSIPLLIQQLETGGQPKLASKVIGRRYAAEYDDQRVTESSIEDFANGNVENKFKCMAEDKSVHLPFSQRKVDLPNSVRSTFLMVFSPDGDKVASTHGDHKVYISRLTSGKVIQVLKGHPRTPWCLAFHPSLTDVVASGCLAGEVRVWDLRSGASERWVSANGSVITSIAFHPFDHVILVATVNELHFWDWRQSDTPFMTVSTGSEKEKLRFVRFDKMGTKIITGISNPSPGLRPPSSSGSNNNPFNFTPIGPRSPFGMFPIMNMNNTNSNRASPAPSSSSSASSPPPRAEELPIDVPSTSRSDQHISGSSQWRMSLLNRLTHVNRQFESSERTGMRNSPVSSLSSTAGATVTNSLSVDQVESSGSINRAQVSSYSQGLMNTFRRLHSLCTRLAQVMQDQQSSERLRDASRDVRSSEASFQVNDLLMRLQESLQSMSSAAVTTAIAQEEIQHVRRRVNEILERLVNVSGYRWRLSNLRDQIYEVAERYATGLESNDIPGSQRWDLIQCLWLVDMSIQLTRQMQRILAADYRLTQIAISNSSGPSSSSNSSTASLLSSLSHYAASSGIDISNDSELLDSLSVPNRNRASLILPSPFHSTRNNSSTAVSSPSTSSSVSSGTSPSPRFHAYGFSAANSHSFYRSRPTSSTAGNNGQSLSSSSSSHNVFSGLFESRISNDSHTAHDVGSSSGNFSIPLLRVSGPDDFPSSEEPTVERPFIHDIFGHRRLRSPPLPEIQQVLQSTSSTANAVTVSSAPPIIIPSSPQSDSSSASDARRPPSILPRRAPRAHPITGLPWNSPGNHLWFANNVGPSGGGSAWAPHSDMGFFSGSPGGANQTHRLQCWDYSRLQVPDLRNSEANVIVSKAKIFNDASVDVNDEGTLLAALVPIENQMSVNLCIYSLERKTFSQCLYLWTFGMNAISVSLSPLSRYIVVGLSTPRSVYSMSYPPAEESVTVGQVFQLSDAEKSCPRLEHVRNINVSRGDESFSLNSIRWLPHAGDGFIYGTNRGHLVICRPEASVKCCNNPWSASGNVGNSRTSTGTQTVMSPVRASRSLSLSSTSSSEFSSSRSRTNLSSNSPQTNADDSSASVQGDQ